MVHHHPHESCLDGATDCMAHPPHVTDGAISCEVISPLVLPERGGRPMSSAYEAVADGEGQCHGARQTDGRLHQGRRDGFQALLWLEL